jgi:hypothetical protein
MMLDGHIYILLMGYLLLLAVLWLVGATGGGVR